MPYKTRFGSHYHMTEGCHGATIPCGTEGLSPCSDCCEATPRGGKELGEGVSGALAGTMGMDVDESEWERTTVEESRSGAIFADTPDMARGLADAGAEGYANGQPMPDEELTFEEIFAKSFGVTKDVPKNMTPASRIKNLFEIIDDPKYDDAILVLSDIADGRPIQKGRDTEQAIVTGVDLTKDLVEMARNERDPERQETILYALGSLANDGILKGVLSSMSEFPASWHQTHSLSTACNQHDMFYITKALVDKSPRKRMTIDDFEEGVVPMLDTLAQFAESGFRKFPRTIVSTKRWPDGPDGGRAWGTQESVLVLAEDVDDPDVLDLMDRDDVRGKSKMDVYHRGVPGYWVTGQNPQDERRQYVDTVKWMVSHSAMWNRRRGRQAIRDFDENMMPILSWIDRRGVMDGIKASGNVEALDLL